jgi:hypothetical protein
MVLVNLNTVLNTVNPLVAANAGRLVTAQVPAMNMPTDLFPGLPESKPIEGWHLHLSASPRIGRSDASRPGHRAARASTLRTIATATARSRRCSQHQQSDGHDYQSYDHRDVQRTPISCGSAVLALNGK